MAKHVPQTLQQLLLELRIPHNKLDDSSPSLAELVNMTADERKIALTNLGLKKVSHKSKLKKRLDQLNKVPLHCKTLLHFKLEN
mmetsp:Transcript_3547/g.6617  ORF Transcript_3547/g.6617 Transcript_3547/m.6617 type:complete len:84 (+) Transcript_3547:54-305(+)